LAACLTGTTLLAFWGALASMRLYAGALFDQNGVRPLKVSVLGKISPTGNEYGGRHTRIDLARDIGSPSSMIREQ
jgi:hypothetical protein